MEEINAKNIVDDTAPLESHNPQANSSDAAVDKQIEMSRVGKSVFYDCLELSPTAEKQDFMKPEQSDTDEESKSTQFECKRQECNKWRRNVCDDFITCDK